MTATALLADPARCAVVTMECQRGVIGDLATFPDLAKAVAESAMLEPLIALVSKARDAGVLVVHATAEFRADRVGSASNAPLLRYAASIPGQLTQGSASAELVHGLTGDGRDIVSSRLHGVSPFIGTDLDSILRSAKVSTLVACGVSLNVGVLGLVIEAVNLGYDVVLAADATTAVPHSAGEEILRNTLSALCVTADVSSIIEAWKQ